MRIIDPETALVFVKKALGTGRSADRQEMSAANYLIDTPTTKASAAGTEKKKNAT